MVEKKRKKSFWQSFLESFIGMSPPVSLGRTFPIAKLLPSLQEKRETKPKREIKPKKQEIKLGDAGMKLLGMESLEAEQEKVGFTPFGIPDNHPLATAVAAWAKIPMDYEFKNLPRGVEGKTKKDLIKWINKRFEIESPQEVESLQKRFGLEELVKPGVSDELTKWVRLAYFFTRSEMGKTAADESVKRYTDMLAEQKLDVESENERRRVGLKNRAYELWTGLTGKEPDIVGTDWLASKFEEGWADADFYRFLRKTSGFQKRFPGIGEDESPLLYLDNRNRFNQAFAKLYSKPAVAQDYLKWKTGRHILDLG